MAERPPELIEPIGETGVGTAWRARRPDGTPVIATRVPLTDPGARDQALARLRQLAHIDTPTLAPVLGWWADAEAVWFVTEAEEGVPLPGLPNAEFLSPLQAAAVSLAAVEGVNQLHSQDMGHGALTSGNVRVMPDGQVRLTGHHLAVLTPPTAGERAAELRRAGRIMCEAFGIPPERNPREAPRAVEHAAPALVQTVRTVAAGGMGADAALAIDALRETAGPLTRPERLETGRDELAALVRAHRSGKPVGNEVRFRGLGAPLAATAAANPPAAPAATPPTPAASRPSRAPAPAPVAAPRPVPPAAAAAPAARSEAEPERSSWAERRARPMPHEYDVPSRSWGRTPVVAIAAVVLLLLIGGGYVATRSLGGAAEPGTTRSSPSARPSPTAAISPSPVPAPVPSFAPASVGSLKGLDLKVNTLDCAPGNKCTFEVSFHMTAAPGHQISWSFKVFDRCTYATTDASGGTFTTHDGWTLAIPADTVIALPPAKGQLAVVAIGTNGGDTAASAPVLIGPDSTCA